MNARESSHDIDQAACRWAARLDRAPLAPEDEQALQAWLDGDSRRKGALLRAQAVTMMSESARALGPHFDPDAFAGRAPPAATAISRRRALMWAGGSIAAASAVAIGIGMPAAAAVISTGRGEIRLVPLKDGSTVLLNTDSSIGILYREGERTVALLKGEAYFAVARDERRPFVVQVRGRRLETIQAAFRVRMLDAHPVNVLVHQGLVELERPSIAAAAGRMALAANTQLNLADAGGRESPVERPQLMSPEAVSRDLAWREGKLAFEGEALRQAADTFARYSDTSIDIGDPELAREPVTGLFAANDPLGFSRAIASIFDARLHQDGNTITLTRAAKNLRKF